ncbi:MAG: S8 family serine peptidase [Pirellulales bacterium]
MQSLSANRQSAARRFEELEDRQMMAADFYADEFFRTEADIEATLDEVQQALINAHEMTGVANARNAYGLMGTGQTVVVIDTGIAYDHEALGGGFGVGYRVVAGYDFAEADGNPYDDGPSGAHGTHVAGIIGSDNATYSGVAPEVDLIALRVFNDSGAGYFSWIDSALDWVHANRNSFANPITTVNISIGSGWNSDTVPPWAVLEDEFAQLEADGIFISVAAGNGFASYNTPGLDYPAASQYVVPVAAVDDNGQLSYFSQRNSRVIAAPGRSIVSTVPDYVGDHDGLADDFRAMSGTSMAAPYVAGASVLIREALEFVGTPNVNQDMIYDWMRNTADAVWDPATNQYYSRLNVGRALDIILPDDEFGSTAATAHNLGIVADTASVNGIVGRLDDVDYFRFTAGDTGTVHFGAEVAEYLTADWRVSGASGVVVDATGVTFDVVAGQSYTVGLATDDGIGHYSITVKVSGDGSGSNWMQDREYVRELYNDLLRRNPDAGGWAYWVGQLQSGMSREQIVSSLTLSAERLSPIVDSYYARYLHRQSDAGGRSYWVGRMQSGESIADVESLFVNSPEYSRFNASNYAFVDALYADILYRRADGGGRDYWANRLGGGLSRSDLSEMFLYSREKLTQTIDAYYFRAFDHAIDSTSRNFYIDQIENGLETIDSLIESWLTSDEYYNHASST